MGGMFDQVAVINRRHFLQMSAAALALSAGHTSELASLPEDTRASRSLFDGRTLGGWVQAENNAVHLSTGSVLDAESFLHRLGRGQDAVSSFLRNCFDESLKTALVAGAPVTDSTPLLSSAVKQINAALDGPPFYSAERFAGVVLRPETQALLRQEPHGERLARLNKLLIEDAFPSELAKSPESGWIVKEGCMASTGAGRGVIYTAQDFARYRLTFSVRHVSGHPDHQAGVLFFCMRPGPNEKPLDALGGLQFQLPMGSHWDYRPGKNNGGEPFFTTVNKSPYDRHAWTRVELLVDAGKGTARVAAAQPPGSLAIELARFSDPTAGRAGPIAWQMHNAGLFDEYKDIRIEVDPVNDELVTTRPGQS